MKSVTSFLLITLLSVFLPAKSLAQTDTEEETLFQLGLALMLTKEYQDAEACFAYLLQKDPRNADYHTNRGINFAYWGMSTMTEHQLKTIIRYVFPFEVATEANKKGNQTVDSLQMISWLLNAAQDEFEFAVRENPRRAGAHLNLGSIMAIQSRWKQDNSLLRPAMTAVQKARRLAKDGSLIKGYSLIVEGIIYDYIGELGQRDAQFDLAEEQFGIEEAPQVKNLLLRNKAISRNPNATRTLVLNQASAALGPWENIDGISLYDLMRSGDVDWDEDLTRVYRREPNGYDPGDIGRKEGTPIFVGLESYFQSTLYVFMVDESSYGLFHRTNPDYMGQTAKEIALGETEANVRDKEKGYGDPNLEFGMPDGKILMYEGEGILFFINTAGQVSSWMLWMRKE